MGLVNTKCYFNRITLGLSKIVSWKNVRRNLTCMSEPSRYIRNRKTASSYETLFYSYFMGVEYSRPLQAGTHGLCGLHVVHPRALSVVGPIFVVKSTSDQQYSWQSSRSSYGQSFARLFVTRTVYYYGLYIRV